MPVDARRVSDDEFAMWRAVFAFAMVDGNLSLEKQKILSHHTRDVTFSKEHIVRLREDMKAPQDIEAIYCEIKIKAHQNQFCALARTLVWCDGDIGLQEKEILQHIGCIKSFDALDALKDSKTHSFYRDFTEVYETIGSLKSGEPAHLFTTAA
jgi:hypothetical protein